MFVVRNAAAAGAIARLQSTQMRKLIHSILFVISLNLSFFRYIITSEENRKKSLRRTSNRKIYTNLEWHGHVQMTTKQHYQWLKAGFGKSIFPIFQNTPMAL